MSQSGLIESFGSNSKFVYSDYSNSVYAIKHSGYGNNFLKIDLDTNITTSLAPNTEYTVFGSSFAYSNFVYFLNHYDDEVWGYNIDIDTWSMVTTVPFNTDQFRNRKITCLVKDEYVYFANGGLGTAFNDFWRLNLNSLQWEQLPNHPNPKEVSTGFVYNNELYFASNEIYIYNIQNQMWRTLDKSGFRGLSGELHSFIQSGVPYILGKVDAINASDEMYMGDMLQ
jgi:N-acetylneuraminic acid mutarotase